MSDKEPKYHITFKDGEVADSKGLGGKRVGVGQYNIWSTDEDADINKTVIEVKSFGDV